MYKKLSAVVIIIALTSIPTIAESNSSSAEVSRDNSEIPEILVTGAMSPIGLERLGKPVSIITHKELQERTESTVGELLSNEPGVSSTYFGPGASRPVIRGQSKQRVRVLENGLDSGDVSDVSEDHAVSVDPLSVQRIDVLRGPSTLLYGSSAIGGVVNMIDNSIAENPIGKPITGEIDLRAGDSADEERTGGVSLNGEIESFNWHLSGFSRETENIEIPGYAESSLLRQMEEEEADVLKDEDNHESENDEIKGLLENSDTRTKGLKIGGSHVWDEGYVGLSLKLIDSNYGIPGGHHHHEEELHHEKHSDEDHEHEEDSEEISPRIDMNQFKLENRGEVRLDDDFYRAVRFGFAYSKYEHKELEGDEIATQFDKDSFETRFELTHGHDDGFEGGFGTQLRYDDFKAKGEEAFVPTSKTFSPALFAIEDFKITEKLVWQVGGRYEFTSVDPEDSKEEDFHTVSASTGPVLNLDDKGEYSSGVSFSFSERAPSSTELFANGAHLATQSYEIGDSSLNKERAVGAEVIFRKNSGRLTGDLSIFWQHYFDYINLTPTGEEEEELPVFEYGIDRARFWGFEASTDFELLSRGVHGLHLYSQIDYVRGENISDSDPLPRITPLRGKVGVKYLYSNASIYVEGVFVDDQERLADFEIPTDSYSLLNAGISYQIPMGEQYTYELYARATNLTNEEARIHSSFLKDVAPLRGRAFFAGVRVAF